MGSLSARRWPRGTSTGISCSAIPPPVTIASDGPPTVGDPTVLAKHSLLIAGHRTSVSLEGAFWNGLRVLAARRGLSVAALVAEIDAGRGAANLSSAIRVHVLRGLCGAAAAEPAP